MPEVRRRSSDISAPSLSNLFQTGKFFQRNPWSFPALHVQGLVLFCLWPGIYRSFLGQSYRFQTLNRRRKAVNSGVLQCWLIPEQRCFLRLSRMPPLGFIQFLPDHGLVMHPIVPAARELQILRRMKDCCYQKKKISRAILRPLLFRVWRSWIYSTCLPATWNGSSVKIQAQPGN